MIKNKVFQNASWIIGCKLMQMLMAVVISMLTARYLGPSNYGLISYAASLVSFCLPIMQLGLPSVLVRELIDRPEKEGETLGTSLLMSLLSAVVCIGGVISFTRIANAGERETILVAALYSVILLFQVFDLFHYWFQAKLLSKYASIAALVAHTAMLAYKVFLLVTQKNVYWFALSNAIDHMLAAVLLWIIYKKMRGRRLCFSFSTAKKLFADSRHYIVSGLMVTVFAQTDRIMIKLMLGDTETGYYAAAIYCATISAFVFSAIIDSYRPVILEAHLKDSNAFKQRMTELYAIIIFLSLAQSLFMTLLAKPIILILYGSAYLPAVPALQIAVWFTTFSYLGAVRDVWILANEQQRYLWIINLSGAVANVLLNLMLIPIWGILGAAAASVVTQFFTNVAMGFILRPIRANNKLMIKGCSPLVLLPRKGID